MREAAIQKAPLFLVRTTYPPPPTPKSHVTEVLFFDPQDAVKNNSFYGSELKIEKGDLKKGFSEADNVVSGMAAACGRRVGDLGLSIKSLRYTQRPREGKWLVAFF